MHMGEGIRTSLGTRAGSAATQAWLISECKSTTIFPTVDTSTFPPFSPFFHWALLHRGRGIGQVVATLSGSSKMVVVCPRSLGIDGGLLLAGQGFPRWAGLGNRGGGQFSRAPGPELLSSSCWGCLVQVWALPWPHSLPSICVEGPWVCTPLWGPSPGHQNQQRRVSVPGGESRAAVVLGRVIQNKGLSPVAVWKESLPVPCCSGSLGGDWWVPADCSSQSPWESVLKLTLGDAWPSVWLTFEQVPLSKSLCEAATLPHTLHMI